MRRVVNTNIVAANAFLTTKQDVLDKEDIKRYVDIVREKANYKTKFFIGSFDVTQFTKQLDFIFNVDRENKYVYILTEVNDDRVLRGYFRRDMTSSFVRILKEEEKELIKEELKQIKENDKQYVKRMM